jgi:predicted PurR-regulated permease PerM
MRTVVLPFAVGLVLAYLLMPIVSWLEKKLPPRRKWPGFRRIVSVLIAFLLLLCIVGGLGYLIVTAVVDAVLVLLDYSPNFIGASILEVQNWIQGIIDLLPEEIQEGMFVEGGINVGNYIRNAMMGAVSLAPRTFNTIFGFAVLPFFLFYLLKDSEKLKKSYNAAVSPRVAEHSWNIIKIVERVLGRYIKAQILLGFIVAYFTFIGLWLFNFLQPQYVLALALLAGVAELIPTLGPWIGGGIAVIVTLAVAPEKAIWVALLFVGIQLLENSFLVPKIQSSYLRIHPAVMIVLLVFGAYIAGFWGLLLAGPLVATFVQIVNYVRDYYTKKNNPEAVEAEEPAA